MIEVQGTDKYYASNIGDIFTPNLDQLQYLPDDLRTSLTASNGFIGEALANAESLRINMVEQNDVLSGTVDKIYKINEALDLVMTLGKQTEYLMCLPALKNLHIEGELEIKGYQPLTLDVGEDDPVYRDVYSGYLQETMSGYKTRVWVAGKAGNLSIHEQLTVLANHDILLKGMDKLVGYSIPEGRVDVDSEGNQINVY